MSPTVIFYVINAILILNFVLDRVLDYLNNKSFSPELPASLSAYYDAEKYKKSLLYHREKDRLGTWSETLGFAAIMVFLWLKGFGWLMDVLEPHFSNNIILALCYFGILSLASGLLGLPFELYNIFHIEEKYGFNKTTPKTYIIDKIKGLLLAIIIGGGLGYLFLWLITAIGHDFWLYAWGAGILLTLFLNMFYTSLIVPIFNKLAPLPAGSLREKIEAYAARVNFPVKNILVINGSKRSSKANAFFSGMGRGKKIVLYDTLIEKHTDEELVAILAHEAGHYKKKHIIYGMMLSWLQMGFMLWLLSQFIFSNALSVALGAIHAEIAINLIAFGILFEPVSLIIGIFMNLLSRKNEYEADAYAAKTADKQAFIQALIRLSTDNLSNLKPHPAYVFFHYSHPTLLQRIENIEHVS